MGFPASDFDECAPMIWSHGERAARVADALFARASEPTHWRESLLAPRDAAAQAIALAANASRPVVIADTQDNPGAGGDSNTTGMLHALVAQGAGTALSRPGGARPDVRPRGGAGRARSRRGAEIDITLGTVGADLRRHRAIAPLRGRYKVVKLSDGVCTLQGADDDRPHRAAGAERLPGDRRRAHRGGQRQEAAARPRAAAHGGRRRTSRCASWSSRARTTFAPTSSRIASHVLVAKAVGPMAADPADLPWRKLAATTRTRP